MSRRLLWVLAMLVGCAAGPVGAQRPEPRPAAAERGPGQPLRRERTAFGVVDHRDVDLRRLRERLAIARGCKRRPSRSGSAVLRPLHVGRAGCRVRPYHGTVSIAAVGGDGSRVEGIMELPTDRDGRIELAYADADASLRALGLGGLDGFARLELGRGAWAGTIDLNRLRRFLAQWHYRWVIRGRGHAGLLAFRHREHEHASQMEALALEARMARQQNDYRAVLTGRMSASSFLERHVWSPFRHAVEMFAGGHERIEPDPEGD